jgi:glycosyltransferase involved in cell wall biosynthesis
VSAPGKGQPPKVSVVSITYNHEAYIREALDGFVAQKTDFPVEIIIADDASTDRTPAVIQEYAERHPKLFRPILRPANVGIHANLSEAMSAARGQYLALCEGDDYWTDPLKLSKQVAFLDQHPETTLCFHPVRMTWDDGRADDSEFPPAPWRKNLSVDGLLKRNFIQTNSVVYRRLPRYDDIPPDMLPMDWYLHLRHAVHGTIAMLPETMSVYRRHAQGVWYDSVADQAKFWVARGPAQAALYEAMLELISGDRRREMRVVHLMYGLVGEIAKIPGPTSRTLLQSIIAQHPRLLRRHGGQRLLTTLALQYQRAQTASEGLKSLRRREPHRDG